LSTSPFLYHDLASAELLRLSAQARALADDLTAAASPPLAPRAELHLVDQPVPRGEFDLASAARRYLRARRQREDLFPAELFADPAWDLLLDLFASRIEGHLVSISDACIAAGVPTTTALRWIGKLESAHLVRRRPDTMDCRRTNIELTPDAIQAVGTWLAAFLGPSDPVSVRAAC
jgi:hypothetical protein